MNTIQFDSEFWGSNEPHVTPVCAVIRLMDTNFTYWFPRDKEKFITDWRKVMDLPIEKRPAIISYYTSAEARFLTAMGFTPAELLSWTWLDPYVIWRMLTHSHPSYKYGNYFTKQGIWKTSVPPPPKEYGKNKNEWTEDEEGNRIHQKLDPKHKELGKGLYDALAARFHIEVDQGHKEFMRDLILNGKGNYTDEERDRILLYCQEDVIHLKKLFIDLYTEIHKATSGKCDIPQIAQLSRYIVCCGIMEDVGIPVDVEKLRTLGHNYYPVDDDLIAHCNMSYPIYRERKSTKKEREAGHREVRWVESQDAFQKFIAEKRYGDLWPKTETGKFKKDDNTLEQFSGDGVIELFRHTKKSRNFIKYFRPEGFEKIEKNIGSDNRLRLLLSPFASKTGRNQPSISQGYIFGMSTWLRPLIADPVKTLIGGDFSAQEVALQGWVSGDEKFLSAYASGDPYTWFAQVTGTMVDTVYREKNKFRDKETKEPVDPELQQTCKTIRGSFKAVVLGVGFGMGLQKLALSITASRMTSLSVLDQQTLKSALISSDPVLKNQAEEILQSILVVPGNTDLQKSQYSAPYRASTYLNYHHKIFQQYWRWRDCILKKYYENSFLSLYDGWCLLYGEDRDTSIANFPVQGTAACILRKAVENCILAGLSIISPLHDCIYIVTDNEEQDKKILETCMRTAVASVCGTSPEFIRIDLKKHETNWCSFESTFTEDKQADVFKVLGKYMITRF